MPEPRMNESVEEFVGRCTPIVLEDGAAEDREQAVAMCHSIWKREKKDMNDPHEALLEQIRSRSEKRSGFNYGIWTADRYAKGWSSDVGDIQKAVATLTYSLPEMEVKKKRPEPPVGVEAPKNTLMVFRHILTTSKKDRDGDILRTGGATIDPKMLLLWQHVHSLPIGKMLKVASHTKDELQLYSCIVDMNELCHDAAVMIDNDMGRFSHGFRALDFLEIKGDDKAGREGDETPGGYDVKRFEVLEESLVSVPANPDTETQEVIVGLVEGGKLTSGELKTFARKFRDDMSVRVPVELDLKIKVNGLEVKDAIERRDEEGGREAGASEKAGEVSEEGKDEKGSEDEEVKAIADDSGSGGTEAAPPESENEDEEESKMVCPECDYAGPGKAGKCPECGAKMIPEKKKPEKGKQDFGSPLEQMDEKPEDDEDEGKKEDKLVCPECDYVGPAKGGRCPECGAKLMPKKDFILEKLGRVLSKANEGKLKDAIEDIDEVVKMEITRPAKALLNQAKRGLGDVVASLGPVDQGVGKGLDVKKAMAVVLAKGSPEDLGILHSLIETFEEQEKKKQLAEQFRRFVGS